MAGLPHVLAVGLLAAGLSGCSLLDLLLGTPPFDPSDPFPAFSFPPEPTAEATFTSGRATIEISGDAGPETIVLDRLQGEAELGTVYGTHATWTNGAGWYLTYFGFGDSGIPGGGAYLTIDRIVGSQHWVVSGPSRCITTTAKIDSSGIIGTAVCRGLAWSDFFDAYGAEAQPSTIPGQPAFDADISFEAH